MFTIKLTPIIASYNSNYLKMKTNLTEEYLQIIYRVATENVSVTDIKAKILHDLINMHVLKELGNKVKLNTVVFLKSDIENIVSLISEIAKELADKIKDSDIKFKDASPEIKTFLAGIIGITQGLSKSIRKMNLGAEWKNYTGEYSKTKVDFDENCKVYNSLDRYIFNKRILRGNKYTAVFIGPENNNYSQMIVSQEAIKESKDFKNDILKYLTDSFGDLLSGISSSSFLISAAKNANLYSVSNGQQLLITQEVFNKYSNEVKKLTTLTCEFYCSKLPSILSTLKETTSGLQGVAPESMLMHFWRYFSRVLARKLYEYNFLTDNIKVKGSITVFFDNEIEYLKEALS